MWKTKLKNIFESMVLAWIWLFFLILHIIFFSDSEPTNIFTTVFDKIVMISCFLLYPFSMNYKLQNTPWPFFIQFAFWWLFGVFIIWLYGKLAHK
jgi:hypothetical protein